MIIEIASHDVEWINESNAWRKEFGMLNAPEYFVSDRVMGNGVAVWTIIHPDPGTPDTRILVAQDLNDALTGKVGLGYGLASQFSLANYYDLFNDDIDEIKDWLSDLGCSEEEMSWFSLHDTDRMAPPNRREG